MNATSPPTRDMILRELKAGPRSTLELEEVTGQSSYDVHHHLGVLEDAQLVESSMNSGRTEVFELRTPRRPYVASMVLDHHSPKRIG